MYKTHYIKADKAKLHVLVAGRGKPVLFLHGGPGNGTGPHHFDYFDLRQHKVFLLDQRGCGKSTGDLKTNTTQQLIKDINVVLDHFDIDKVNLFGGSWGSTLALTYAITHPQRVNKMIVYAIWLVGKADEQHMMHTAKQFFPDEYQRMLSAVPSKHKALPHVYLWRQTVRGDRRSAKAIMRWMGRIIRPQLTTKQLDEGMQDFDMRSATIEAYYMLNKCFLPKDFIINNTKKITHIPTSIFHGTYDFICPPNDAHRLHALLKKSTLHMLPVNHGGSPMKKELKVAAKDLF